MKRELHIEIDFASGFCFGVVNAISKAEECVAAGSPVYSLGDIVHNRMEVQRLERLGLRTVTHSGLSALKGNTILIRAHGEPPQTYRDCEETGINIVDATCPVVAKLQRMVGDAWQQMNKQDGQVVILGKRGHAEVIGLCGHTEGKAIVVENTGDLDLVDFSRPIFLLSQTTQSLELFGRVREEILARADDPARVTVRDTICRHVSGREGHLDEFAGKFDVIIFVAGRKSSNGRVLFEVCRRANPASYHIEDPAEIEKQWFAGSRSAGICGATSTPQWLMQEAARRIGELVNE